MSVSWWNPFRTVAILTVCIVVVNVCFAVDNKIVTVDTHLGRIAGIVEGDSDVFLGVRYAKAPVGERRWRPPVAVEPWEPEVLNATVPGPVCYQRPYFSVYPNMNEDCLVLNIWTPHERSEVTNGGGLPVIVFIHGGGFLTGSIVDDPFNGTVLNRFGVVLVAVNYRLGIFGLLNHHTLSKENGGRSYNFGLNDQLFAFEWVKKNIASFGGDPERITAFGHSAGGSSLIYHLGELGLEAKNGKGLPGGLPFQRVIMQSPVCSGIGFGLSKMEKMGAEFMKSFGCDDLACLRNVSADQIQARAFGERRPRFGFFHGQAYPHSIAPATKTIPGLTIHPMEAVLDGIVDSSIDMMIGSVLDEGTLLQLASFPLKPPSKSFYESMLMEIFGEANTRDIIKMYPYFSGSSPQKGLMMDNSTPCESYAPSSPLPELLNHLYFTCPLRTATLALSERQGDRVGKVYRYLFTYRPCYTSGQYLLRQLGSYHGLDVGFAFGTKSALQPGPISEHEWGLAEWMVSRFANFAKTGDPNDDGEGGRKRLLLEEQFGKIEWKAYEREHQSILHVEPVPHAYSDIDDDLLMSARCEMWNRMFPRVIEISGGHEFRNEPFLSWLVNDWLFGWYIALGAKNFKKIALGVILVILLALFGVLFCVVRGAIRKVKSRSSGKKKTE